jgi:hypothetical protein
MCMWSNDYAEGKDHKREMAHCRWSLCEFQCACMRAWCMRGVVTSVKWNAFKSFEVGDSELRD